VAFHVQRSFDFLSMFLSENYCGGGRESNDQRPVSCKSGMVLGFGEAGFERK
jgi:hypothetical protein